MLIFGRNAHQALVIGENAEIEITVLSYRGSSALLRLNFNKNISIDISGRGVELNETSLALESLKKVFRKFVPAKPCATETQRIYSLRARDDLTIRAADLCNEDIKILFVTGTRQARIGIDAPRHVPVHRLEVYKKIQMLEKKSSFVQPPVLTDTVGA